MKILEEGTDILKDVGSSDPREIRNPQPQKVACP